VVTIARALPAELKRSLTWDQGSNLTVDGYYGPKTQDAVRVVQRGESLAQDGFVGPDTWPALRFVAW
jgi:peptidoglycan hydrolase-like protein with peptidoglycan-binding domain